MPVLFAPVERIPAARALGGVHGHIGAAQQCLLAVAVIGIHSDADAAADAKGVAIELERLGQGMQDLPGNVHCGHGGGAG